MRYHDKHWLRRDKQTVGRQDVKYRRRLAEVWRRFFQLPSAANVRSKDLDSDPWHGWHSTVWPECHRPSRKMEEAPVDPDELPSFIPARQFWVYCRQKCLSISTVPCTLLKSYMGRSRRRVGPDQGKAPTANTGINREQNISITV